MELWKGGVCSFLLFCWRPLMLISLRSYLFLPHDVNACGWPHGACSTNNLDWKTSHLRSVLLDSRKFNSVWPLKSNMCSGHSVNAEGSEQSNSFKNQPTWSWTSLIHTPNMNWYIHNWQVIHEQVNHSMNLMPRQNIGMFLFCSFRDPLHSLFSLRKNISGKYIYTFKLYSIFNNLLILLIFFLCW
jgi:hypothetical protein